MHAPPFPPSLQLLDSTSDADVVKFFETVAAKGATLVRFFAFTNGYGSGSVPMRTPLQPRVGVFDESQWRRMDLILATAAKNGIRLIAPLANFEPELGGIDWYVNEVLGSGQPKELFYTNDKVKAAYKAYVAAFLNRKSSITGTLYKDDPVLMSVEVGREKKQNGCVGRGSMRDRALSRGGHHTHNTQPPHTRLARNLHTHAACLWRASQDCPIMWSPQPPVSFFFLIHTHSLS